MVKFHYTDVYVLDLFGIDLASLVSRRQLEIIDYRQHDDVGPGGARGFARPGRSWIRWSS